MSASTAAPALTDFVLSCELAEHEADVRCVAAFQSGQIVSGSRDRSVRVWTPLDVGPAYTAQLTLYGHASYVLPVLAVDANPLVPSPSVLSGSHDKTVVCWNLDNGSPHYVCNGHTDVVSALAMDTTTGVVVSGSWDGTARVWHKDQCVRELRGHEGSVLAVLPVPGTTGDLLTAGADSTIRLWREATCVAVLKGHGGPVRALCAVPGIGFLSCSNDCSVRLWDNSGTNILQLDGHSSFVYALAVSPDGSRYASGGEDRALKLWAGDACVQTIMHPATIWSVCFLPNGDVVTGGSDGVVRVWTRDVGRAAAADTAATYWDNIRNASISKQQVGDLSLEKTPGLEALQEPGARDGQHKLVKVERGGGWVVEVHQWNAAAGHWEKIGDVTDAQGSTQKEMLNGASYDYVFNVELEEGVPPLKLGYNAGQNPYEAAQQFLYDNDLHQGHLDVVANFIAQNTKSLTFDTSQSGAPVSGGDPLTGGSRYVPRGQQQHQAAPPPPSSSSSSSAQTNPFLTAFSAAPAAPTVVAPFPNTKFLLFETSNHAALAAKLQEFNTALSSAASPLALNATENTLLTVLLAKQQNTAARAAFAFSHEEFLVLLKLLQWPSANLLPCLDLARLLLAVPAVANFASDASLLASPATNLVSVLLALAAQNAAQPKLLMLIIRAFANIFASSPLPGLLATQDEAVLDWSADHADSAAPEVRGALATLLLDFATYLYQTRGPTERKLQVVSLLYEVLSHAALNDAESTFRLIVALGTLMYQDDECRSHATTLGVQELLAPLRSSADSRIVVAVVALTS